MKYILGLIFISALSFAGPGPAGNIIQFSNSGVPTNVSNTAPLPVTGTGSGGSLTVNQGNAGASSWLVNVNQVGGSSISLGQKTQGSSLPVTIASDQSPLPITGSISVTNPSVGLTGAAVPTSANFIGVKNQAGNLTAPVLTAGLALLTDSSATTQPVSLSSIPLPTGAATSALQVSGNAILGGILLDQTNGTQITQISNFPASQPVSVSTLPLPTGAATSALQTSGNAILSTIAANTGASTVNNGGSTTTGTVSTAISISPPLGAVGFVLMNMDTSTANIRWSVGSAVSTSSGQQLQPGRSSDFVSVNATVNIIAESGTQNYSIQWITK